MHDIQSKKYSHNIGSYIYIKKPHRNLLLIMVYLNENRGGNEGTFTKMYMNVV